LQKEIEHLNKALNRYRKTVTELNHKDQTILKAKNLVRLNRTKTTLRKSQFGEHDSDESSLDDSLTLDAGMSKTSEETKHYSLNRRFGFIRHQTQYLDFTKLKPKKKVSIKLDMINSCLNNIAK